MRSEPPSYVSAEALCIDAPRGEYGASDIVWDQTRRSLCSYGPLYEEPTSGSGEYNNSQIAPRAEINGGLGYNYASAVAYCDREPDPKLDYGYSDMVWSTINRSICNWPPGDDEDPVYQSPGSDQLMAVDYTTSNLTPLSEIEGRYIETNLDSDLAPWSNSLLTFSVETGQGHVDPETGNYTPILEQITYRAYLNIQPPNYQEKQGVDVTAYTVTGRLLNPAVLDERLQNGAQAEAKVNNYKGRFELRFPLHTQAFAYPTIRQELAGIFHVMGGRN